MEAPGSTLVTDQDGVVEYPVVPVEPNPGTAVTVGATGGWVSSRKVTATELVALPAASVTVTTSEYAPSPRPPRSSVTLVPQLTVVAGRAPAGPVAAQEMTAPGSTSVTDHNGLRE